MCTPPYKGVTISHSKKQPVIRESDVFSKVSGSIRDVLRLFTGRSQKKSIGVAKNRACPCVHGMKNTQKPTGAAAPSNQYRMQGGQPTERPMRQCPRVYPGTGLPVITPRRGKNRPHRECEIAGSCEKSRELTAYGSRLWPHIWPCYAVPGAWPCGGDVGGVTSAVRYEAAGSHATTRPALVWPC